MPNGTVEGLSRLLSRRTQLTTHIESLNQQVASVVSNIDLSSAGCFFPGVQICRIWGNDNVNVSLLVNKNRLGGCGILLWGVQFANKLNTLTVKIDKFEASFMVFDGQPGSNDFAILNGAGPGEAEKLFKMLRKVCSYGGINYVFVKNAAPLMGQVGITPGREFKEISEFYMMIARRDGSVIPGFDFINPQNSSVFWNNG